VIEAINIVVWPEHVGLDPEAIAMLIVGVTAGVTVIVIALDVTVAGLEHTALDPKSQVTISPFTNTAEL
jgi:hypothetical protein